MRSQSASAARPIQEPSRSRLAGILCVAIAACSDSSPPASGDIRDSSAVDGRSDRLTCDAPAGDVARVDLAASDLVSPCPRFAAPVKVGALSLAEISEASGLVASSKNPGVLWTHNDSGDKARVFPVDTKGKSLGIFELGGVTANDWEDIAVGPGPISGESYLYVGDIGDNDLERKSISVLRVQEPLVPLTHAGTSTLGLVETLTFTYPDGAHNAETLLVDSLTGDIFVLTKSNDGRSQVYRGAAPQDPKSSRTLTWVAVLALRQKDGPLAAAMSPLLTGGDISRDGQVILLRTYLDVFLWTRPAGAAIGSVLAGAPCVLPVPSESQGESIASDPTSGGYYTVSEKVSQPLYFVARQ